MQISRAFKMASSYISLPLLYVHYSIIEIIEYIGRIPFIGRVVKLFEVRSLKRISLSALETRFPLAARFVRAATWSTIASIVASLLSVASTMLVARAIDRTALGEYIILQTMITALGSISTAGLSTAITRLTAGHKNESGSRLGRLVGLAEGTTLLFSLTFVAGLAIFRNCAASHLFRDTALANAIVFAALTVCATSLDAIYKGVLVGLGRLSDVALSTFAGMLFLMPVIAFSARTAGLDGAVGAFCAGAVVQMAVSRMRMRKALKRDGISIQHRGSMSEGPALSRFAIPASIAAAAVAPANWVVQTLLSHTPSGYGQVALLGVCMQWFNAVILLPSSLSRVVLPIVTELFASREAGGAKKFVKYSIVTNAALALPAAAVVGAGGKLILGLYGHNFTVDGLPSFWLALAVGVIVSVQYPIGSILWAKSRPWSAALSNVGWACGFVSLSILLVGRGAFGVLAAMGLAYLVYIPVLAWLVRMPSRNSQTATMLQGL